MKNDYTFTIIFILIACLIIAVTIVLIENENIQIKTEIKAIKHEIASTKVQILDLQEQITELPSKMSQNQLYGSNEELSAEEMKIETDEEFKVSRGIEKGISVLMRVTAYDLSYESCKKDKTHPEYGIGANGEPVKEFYSVAMGPSYPFGTKIYMPYFSHWENKGYFVCTDRGSAIKDDCIDVYFGEDASEACNEFGVKELEVYILGGV